MVIDKDVDFNFAPIQGLTYWEKEKVCKIFLSKTKTYGVVKSLIKNAKTETESFIFSGKRIKTTIDKGDKKTVIDHLINIDKEYAPLFKHYKEFILNSEISFTKPEEESEGDKSDQNKNQSGSGGQPQNNKDKNNENNKQGEKEEGNNDDKSEQDKNDSSNESQSQNKKPDSSQPSSENILKNKIALDKALNDVKEEEYNFDKLSTFGQKTKTQIQQTKNVDTVYTQQQKDVADNLTKMLDISFDPTSDTVKNLRLGKLDITKIAEVPAGNIAIYKQEIENQTTKPFSVVILCDESASMDRYGRIHPQYDIVKSLYMSFSDILPQEKIFVYGHSGQYGPELYVYHDLYNPNFMMTIDRMIERNFQENYDGPIIEEVYKNVRAATSDRIIFIVLSDGAPLGHGYGGGSDILNMKQIIEKCKRDEFVTIGVGIQSHHVKGLYQYSTIVENLQDMPKKVSHIVNHVVKTEFQ